MLNKGKVYPARLRKSEIARLCRPLRIQTGRYSRNNIPRNERYCQLCNLNDLEDEHHFVCVCPIYNELRRNYINKYV